MVSWLVQYLSKDPGPNFNNGPGNNSPECLFQFPRTFQFWNAEKDYHSLYYRRPFDFTIFPPKCYEASIKRAQSANKNCLKKAEK